MSYVTLLNSEEQIYTSSLESVMRNFSFLQDFKCNDIKDLSDFPTILKEGKVQELSKCIQNVLNFNFCLYTAPSNISIFDTSFVEFFQTAQLIIQFLLHWKSELLKENLKLKNEIQELEKLRKDIALRKLEVRELRNQLSNFMTNGDSNSKDVDILECSICQKMFVSCSFLYAHHKKRHGDQPFLFNHKDSHVRTLQDEIQNLKSQLTMLNNVTSSNSVMTNDKSSATVVKMKITPEISCLTTQEKFWRGKVKEIESKFEKERVQMENILEEIKIENHDLKEQISNLERKPETVSVLVQTENLLELSDDFLKNTIEWSRQRNSTPVHKAPNLDDEKTFDTYETPKPLIRNSLLNDKCTEFVAKSILPKHETSSKPDVIDEVDSFLEKYNKKLETSDHLTTSYEGQRQEVKKVITKLFTSDESSDQLANKLFKIYDKRTSLVSDGESSNALTVNSILKIPETGNEKKNTEDKDPFKDNEKLYSNPTFTEETDNSSMGLEKLSTNSDQILSPPLSGKSKSRFLPFFKNIPWRILKNYSKSRKIIEDKVITKRLASDGQGNSKTDTLAQVQLLAEQKLNELKIFAQDTRQSAGSVGEITNDGKPKTQLVSALKKSRSTGNIAKKVAFSDNLPTLRTNSESNLSEISYFDHERPQFNNSVTTVAEVNVKDLALPIPARRTRTYYSSENPQN